MRIPMRVSVSGIVVLLAVVALGVPAFAHRPDISIADPALRERDADGAGHAARRSQDLTLHRRRGQVRFANGDIMNFGVAPRF